MARFQPQIVTSEEIEALRSPWESGVDIRGDKPLQGLPDHDAT